LLCKKRRGFENPASMGFSDNLLTNLTQKIGNKITACISSKNKIRVK
jgi:hypothetical protein